MTPAAPAASGAAPRDPATGDVKAAIGIGQLLDGCIEPVGVDIGKCLLQVLCDRLREPVEHMRFRDVADPVLAPLRGAGDFGLENGKS